MNKTYLIAGIAVIIVIAVYFVFFGSVNVFSFDSGLNEINSLWQEQGLKPEYLVFPLKVHAAEKSRLLELKSGLIELKEKINESDSADKEKLDLLLEIQLNLVDNALLQKENFDLIDFFEENNYDFDVLCSYSNKVEELQKNLVLQENSAEAFNEKVIAFSSSFPAETQKSGLSLLSLETSFQQNLSELNSMVLILKGVC